MAPGPVNLPGLSGRVDVALLSLGTTLGLRHADEALADVLQAAGLSCRVVRVRLGATAKLRRQITVIDLVEGLAARRAARATAGARAVIVSSATTSLLIRRPRVPWAVRFDSPTALNRPGWSGAWQRARERRVFAAADLLLPYGRTAAAAAEAYRHADHPAPGRHRGRAAARAARGGGPRLRGLAVEARRGHPLRRLDAGGSA